ncbi:hypothetical protein [Psychrobacillus sp. OK032]|uniref:hypothetical protein n=1 Tax=Psychrobacillus sp. OK032 TaxID=1884358 RepID=UPI0015A651B8|nr:hypothetical protein [Psychrobacillus sp. OK032]
MMILIRIFVLNVIVGLNLNVVTLIANIALTDQKNLYLTSSVIQLKGALLQEGVKPFSY